MEKRTSSAVLVEDNAHAACWRLLGRPRGRTAYHAFLILRDAADALGNHRLAQLEDAQDDAREVEAGWRLAMSLAAERLAG